MKHPVAVAFVVAVVTTLALAGFVLAVVPTQQSPWALAAAFGAFPFVWFFAWLVTNAIAWWRGMREGEAPPAPGDER